MDQMAYAFTEKRKRWLLVVLFNIMNLNTNAIRVIRQARLQNARCLMMITSSFHHCGYKLAGTPAGVKESILPNPQPSHQTEHLHFSEVFPPHTHTSPDSLYFYTPSPSTHTLSEPKEETQTDSVANLSPTIKTGVPHILQKETER
ncbi:hypothetical protein PoB_002499800 [Plakobranchus ocellatus]|uniref:Uncharacterized protein n=1 Tax=Plakobranchus ocellatus TaxID=259542 RepID=A0AAV3ZUD9_9GAST|nr:hypothetical protein PoB_002499800 [Plakobranchus ocellatus]